VKLSEENDENGILNGEEIYVAASINEAIRQREMSATKSSSGISCVVSINVVISKKCNEETIHGYLASGSSENYKSALKEA